MAQQGQQMPRTITLKELGLTGEAWVPISVSAVVFLFVAITGVLVTTPAWYILGVGKPFLPEFLMPVTAFVLMLITTGGLTVAWSIAVIGLLVIWEVLGKKATFSAVRLFSGLSLLIVWFLVGTYIHMYGAPRPELEAQVLAQNPSLHYALYTFHRYNDWMHLVFTMGALVMLWGYGDGLLRNRFAQVITLVLIWLTFFSLILTLGLHSAAVRPIPG